MNGKNYFILSIFIAAFLVVSCSLSEDSSRGSALQDEVDPCGDDPRIVDIYGPQKFIRNTGKPFTEEREITAPFPGDFCLVVVNGEHGPPHGKRISSAVISIDGEQVIGPDSFNQNVGLVTESVHLEQGQHVLGVQLRSKPGSFLLVAVRGIPGDLEPPEVTITSPSENFLTKEEEITVYGRIVDNEGVVSSYLVLNGSHHPLELGEEGYFSLLLNLEVGDSVPKPVSHNTIEVVGVDSTGNVGSSTVEVSYLKSTIPREVIVKFRPNTSGERVNEINGIIGAVTKVDGSVDGIYLMLLPDGMTAREGITYYKSQPEVEDANPDVVFQLAYAPNDTLLNEGAQSSIGNVGFDCAWDYTTGSEEVVVAIIDTGIDPSHPDLQGNLWNNVGEDINGDGICDEDDHNGIDEDRNGYVDDCAGWDFCSDDTFCEGQGSNVIRDVIGHGTLVGGVVGAVGDNGYGIAGTNFNVKLMPLNVVYWYKQSGTTYILIKGVAAIKAMNYAIVKNARISTHSYTMDGSDFEGWELSIYEAVFWNARRLGHVAFAAAGNGTGIWDLMYTDCMSSYPDTPENRLGCRIATLFFSLFVSAFGDSASVGYSIDGLDEFPAVFDSTVAVAATDSHHKIAFFSNYGQSVNIAAPGTSDAITSLMPTNDTVLDELGLVRRNCCDWEHDITAPFGGTSAAVPHAAGLAALMLSVNPYLSYDEITETIYNTGSPLVEETAWEFLLQHGFEEFWTNSDCNGRSCMEDPQGLALWFWFATRPYFNESRDIATNKEIDACAAIEGVAQYTCIDFETRGDGSPVTDSVVIGSNEYADQGIRISAIPPPGNGLVYPTIFREEEIFACSDAINYGHMLGISDQRTPSSDSYLGSFRLTFVNGISSVRIGASSDWVVEPPGPEAGVEVIAYDENGVEVYRSVEHGIVTGSCWGIPVKRGEINIFMGSPVIKSIDILPYPHTPYPLVRAVLDNICFW